MSQRSHGDGGVDERSPGHFRLRWRVDGRRYTKAFRGSISDARKELRRLIKSADDGAHVAPDRITLAAWVDRWVALLRRGEDVGRRGLVNARTLERYEELLRLHVLPTLCARPLQRLSASEIDDVYGALAKRLSPRTVHHLHTVFGACLGAAVRKGLLVASPTARAEAPVAGDSDAEQVLDQDQLTQMLTGFRGSVLYPVVAVAAFTGARRNEILALRWLDFEPDHSTLTIARRDEGAWPPIQRAEDPARQPHHRH